MDFSEETLLKIVERWLAPIELRDFRISNIRGGLSGARLWKVTCATQSLCLRQWPAIHPTEQELSDIHSLIAHIWNGGFAIVPLPQVTRAGQSFIHSDGHLWELTHWLPGENKNNLSSLEIDAALTTLAQFHNSAASHAIEQPGPAPGLMKRLTILQRLRGGELAQLEQAIQVGIQTPLRDLAQTMLVDLRRVLPTALKIVEQASANSYPLQWCLRDVHRGNLLFTDNQVTGLVDFGAAAIDSVAGDIARFVGSISGDESQVWRTCLATYQKNHAISQDELLAVAAYDVGGIVASSANWLRWLFVEHREFADSQAIETRLSELAKRLRNLDEHGRQGVLAAFRGSEL